MSYFKKSYTSTFYYEIDSCKFILTATRQFRKDVFLWIPPDDPDDSMMYIDCAWKANDSGIFLDTRGCNQNSPKWIKQFDWVTRREPVLDVEGCQPTANVDNRNPSKRPKLEDNGL